MMRWIRRLFFHNVVEKQMDAELRFHLEQQTAEYVALGMSPEEAHRRAQIGPLKSLPRHVSIRSFFVQRDTNPSAAPFPCFAPRCYRLLMNHFYGD
jgi:hypothetical protein